MKRTLAIALALLVCANSAAFADDESIAPAAGSSATKPAPADEYFGRLKMSILGIRNQLNHLTAQVEGDTGASEGALGASVLMEESIKEWEQKYPRDPWLAKTVYMLVHLYAKMPPEIGHSSAVKALGWLLAKYPECEYTEQALAEVKKEASEASPGSPR